MRSLLTYAACVAVLALLPALPVPALMAGSAPDSPAARVDANVAASPFAGVAAISINGSTYSGVVIAPQYILTAAHVVGAGSAAAMQVTLNPGPTPWTSGVTTATAYPTYSFPYDDLGVLKLAAPVPAGVPVYPLYSGPLQTGLTLLLAGYGASGNGAVGVSVGPAASVKRSGRNSLDALATAVDNSGLTSSFFEYDFDGPTGNGPLGGATLGNALETMVAYGDSGGPSLVAVGAGLQVLGINTFAATTQPNQPVTYTFGEIGGGIVAADPRFASWLQAMTQGTMPGANGSNNDSDGPLPAWSFVLLAGALLLVGGKMHHAPHRRAER
jgi:secreted trypsin-like serine protease